MKKALVDALRLQTMPRIFDGEHYFAYGKDHAVYWSYVQSIQLLGYLRHGKLTNNEVEIWLVKQYIDRILDRGLEQYIRFDYYSTDQVCMANLVLQLYDRYPEERYAKAAERFYEYVQKLPRTVTGNFWHKVNYPYQIWLDGLYMTQLFLTGYIDRFLPEKDYSDTLSQFANVRKLLWSEDEKLYYHACDTSRKMSWADPLTGLSPNVWLRAVGWITMALTEVYPTIAKTHPAEAEPLKAQLVELLEGMLPHCRENMWYQVVNREGEPDNYLETSGSLMLAFAMMRGARLGMISEEYRATGKAVYESVLEHYLSVEDGKVLLGGICQSAGLGMHPERGYMRDGSYAYYTTGEKIAVNNGHGIGALFLAQNEYIQAQE